MSHKRHTRCDRSFPIHSGTRRACRLGRLCQGHLHHHGGDDALGAGGREGRRADRLHASTSSMFAKPFRMPDFFLISGLFLSVVIDRDWRTYLDRKVMHFAYFYVLWVTIQFGFKAPSLAAETELAPRSGCNISNPSSSRSARCGSSICCRSSSSSPS